MSRASKQLILQEAVRERVVERLRQSTLGAREREREKEVDTVHQELHRER